MQPRGHQTIPLAVRRACVDEGEYRKQIALGNEYCTAGAHFVPGERMSSRDMNKCVACEGKRERRRG